MVEGKAFDRTLFVKDGRHIIREVTCVADAMAFLRDWPETRRGPIYNATARACQAAHDGRMPVTGARAALQSFARATRILEQGPVSMSIESWMVMPRSGRGGAPT